MNKFPPPRPSYICIFRWKHGEYADWYPIDAYDELESIEEASECRCGDSVYRMPAIAELSSYTVGPYEWLCINCLNHFQLTEYPRFSFGNIPIMNINSLSEDELLDLYCALFHHDEPDKVEDYLIRVLNRLNDIRKL